MVMQGYCDIYIWTLLRRMSSEVKCLHPMSSRCKICIPSISDVNYHKLSHGAAFYRHNGKNIKVILEFLHLPFFSVGVNSYKKEFRVDPILEGFRPPGKKTWSQKLSMWKWLKKTHLSSYTLRSWNDKFDREFLWLWLFYCFMWRTWLELTN